MRINDILDIIHGELINTPTISSVEHIALDLQSIKRMSLFFAFNKDEVKQAILNGAYCIIFEGEIEVIDNEIAWIRVDLQKALAYLVKYFLILRNLKVILVNEPEFIFAKSLVLNAYFLQDKNINPLLELLSLIYNNKDEDSKKFILTTLNFESLIPNITPFKSMYFKKQVNFTLLKQTCKNSFNNFNLLFNTMFESQILFKEDVYKLNIPMIFLPILDSLLSLEKLGVDVQINNMESFVAHLLNEGKKLKSEYKNKAIFVVKNLLISSILQEYILDYQALLKTHLFILHDLHLKPSKKPRSKNASLLDLEAFCINSYELLRVYDIAILCFNNPKLLLKHLLENSNAQERTLFS